MRHDLPPERNHGGGFVLRCEGRTAVADESFMDGVGETLVLVAYDSDGSLN